MKIRSHAFTLIEVMVALFILAITFMGVIASASHVSRVITALQEKTMALWVSQNVMSEIQLGLWGKVSDGLFLQNQTMMGGKAWYWTAMVTAEEKYDRVVVNVLPDQHGASSVEKVLYVVR